MSQKKSWPLPVRSDVRCGQELKPLQQPWPSTQTVAEFGQEAVARAEIACGQAVAFTPVAHGVTTLKKKGLAPPWKPGQSGNPKGRPLSQKHRITETMRSIVLADVSGHAAEALAQLRQEDVAAYFAVVLKFIPTELLMKLEQGKLLDYSQMTPEEVTEFYKERDMHAKVNSIVDNLDTKYKK